MRLAYLGVTNAFALLRLLPTSSQEKDAEILALRHQLLVLQRQLGPDKVRFVSADRALLAALLHWLPRDVLQPVIQDHRGRGSAGGSRARADSVAANSRAAGHEGPRQRQAGAAADGRHVRRDHRRRDRHRLAKAVPDLVGQQLLASRDSAITGKWVLYRKLENCSITGSNNHGCVLGPMDMTIACTGTPCTIIRTNASADFAPWDHSIPIAFSQGAWQASGTEKWAVQCNHAPVLGSGVAFSLKVTSGQVINGVWRAQGITGRYTINNPATACFSAGTSVEDVSTAPFR